MNPQDVREAREDLLLRETFLALRELPGPEIDMNSQIMGGLASIPAPRRRPIMRPVPAAASVMMALLLLPVMLRSFPASRESVLALLSATGVFLQNVATLTWLGLRTLLSIVATIAGSLEPLTRNEALRSVVQVSAWSLLVAGFMVMAVSIGLTLHRDLRVSASTLTIRDPS